MLIIRKEQMDVFQNEAERNFENEVQKQLRTTHAALVKDMDDDILRKRVAYGIFRAREYGLTWKSNLAIFVILMFDLNPEFDRHPSFSRRLNDTDVDPNERMRTLVKEMTEEDWATARQIAADWPEDLR
jgi:hypothetical protein